MVLGPKHSRGIRLARDGAVAAGVRGVDTAGWVARSARMTGERQPSRAGLELRTWVARAEELLESSPPPMTMPANADTLP